MSHEDTDDWAVVENVADAEEARLIEGFLRSEGIDCQIESLRFNQEPVNLGRLSELRVRVRKDQLELARSALSEQRRQAAEESTDDDTR